MGWLTRPLSTKQVAIQAYDTLHAYPTVKEAMSNIANQHITTL
jgi:hypothetical protein